MAFQLSDFLNPILNKIYNPGSFDQINKTNQQQFTQPYMTQFKDYVKPIMDQSFNYNQLNPYNITADKQLRDFNYDNSANGNWRTGNFDRNQGILNGQLNVGRNQLLESHNNDLNTVENQFTNYGGDVYSRFKNNLYQSPTFLNADAYTPGQTNLPNPNQTGQAPTTPGNQTGSFLPVNGQRFLQ